jgi:cytidine deaminase
MASVLAPEVHSSKDHSAVAATCAAFDLAPAEFAELLRLAVAAKTSAYCPYSRFRVGAAILTRSGAYVVGANVENAAYPVGTCAERVAFGTAVVEGHHLSGGFKALAVATDISPPASPCGMCRQLYV